MLSHFAKAVHIMVLKPYLCCDCEVKQMQLFASIKKKPHAVAKLQGSPRYPKLRGAVSFTQTKAGVFVTVQAEGLPIKHGACEQPIFAMHIHSGGSCSGNETDFFANARTHYNPNNCLHPYHAGDLPPLFGANGVVFSSFLTDRFTVEEIVGRSVILHAGLDDFTSQPAGNAGEKIACGVIKKGR